MKYFYVVLFVTSISFFSKAQTLPPPFATCPATGFQVINSPSNFQTVNLATGTTATVATFAISVNAIGFNPGDNRLYGIKQGAPLGVVVIGSDYSYQSITTSGAALQGSVVGDISPTGFLWCFGGTSVYTVDCNPSDGVNFGKVTIIGAKPSVSITDWSFPASDNTKIYTVNNMGGLIYISTSDLSVHTVMPNGTVASESYGATYFDSNGNFYAKGNTSGIIYKFLNVTSGSPSVVTFSTSSTSAQNDGARCADALAPVIADFGDAPDGYGTFVSSNGPEHLMSSPNPALALLYLGLAITIDADGDANAGATSDSDDGISVFAPIAGGTTSSIPSYVVSITVHNSTAAVANLAGWIDWNNNGTFDAGEIATSTVSAGFSGTSTLTWLNVTLSGPPYTAGTYGRFRISTDALASPGGTVSNGEVEDYFMPFLSVLPVQILSFTAVESNASSHLEWITASEQNNKGFAIERSSNGTVFNQIDFVPSQAPTGTSIQRLRYDYYDTRPLQGINYYRLKQIDFDEMAMYSAVAKLVFGSGSVIVVYPNPSKTKITIEGLKGNENIQLYSNTGQLIKNQKGFGPALILDISKIPMGVYRLSITDAIGNRTTRKIVKE